MEIERKWLVDPASVPYDLRALKSVEIEQIYISFSPTIRGRCINHGEEYVLTVKTHPDSLSHKGLQREEYEFPISASEYENLRKDAKGTVIQKTRYIIPLENGLTEELDLFHDALEGLSYLEIEFPDTDSALAYPDPYWVSRDVTCEGRYKNSALAQYGKP